MLEHWPQLCCVKPEITFAASTLKPDITFGLLPTKLLRFHKNKFDEMPCKLESTENLPSFEICVRSINTQPHFEVFCKFC